MAQSNVETRTRPLSTDFTDTQGAARMLSHLLQRNVSHDSIIKWVSREMLTAYYFDKEGNLVAYNPKEPRVRKPPFFIYKKAEVEELSKHVHFKASNDGYPPAIRQQALSLYHESREPGKIPLSFAEIARRLNSAGNLTISGQTVANWVHADLKARAAR
jgi:hypothetical protein